MADDQVDISDMPDPTTVGLKPAAQDDPTSDMPEPRELFKKATGTYPATQYALDEFMKNPVNQGDYVPTPKKVVQQLAGLPRAGAGLLSSVAGGGVSLATHAVGGTGALIAGAMRPDLLPSMESQVNDKAREWSSKVSNLGNYVPTGSAEGDKFASDLMGVPGNIIKEASDSTLGRVLPDNAYQALGDVSQDIGTDAMALGIPELGRFGVRGIRAAADTAKGAVASEAATLSPEHAAPPAPIKPDVGQPLSGNDLRAQPNPIPAPEGTIHNEVHPAALAPKAAEAPTEAPEPSPATEAQAPAQEPTAQAPTPTEPTDNAQPDMALSADQRAIVREGVAARRASSDEGTPSPGGTQRGSVRLFNSPADEGPQETPKPEQQSERAAHLDAIDKLSGGGLPSRRASAISGDYNATGDDYQMKEVGSEPMRKQIASENDAMHAATENVHESVGSAFPNSVDSTTLGDRGRVTRGAIQKIEQFFDTATNQLYDRARATVGNNPMPKLQRVSEYLNDDSNFTNDAEIGLQRAAKQRLDRLWSTGDPARNTPAGSVTAAERFREFINEKYSPQNGGVSKALKNATDMDVAEHGGPGLFQTARAMRAHSAKMLEEPDGIRKLLTPEDSSGINHKIPEHKVMDYIADLPREQHEQVLNVLRAGAHLGGGELAEGSASAIREIQAHMISRMHAAATNADGSWNARKFYNASDRYARNMPDTFKGREDVLKNLKTVNDAGNTLSMDKHYPGAIAQGERTGMLGHALEMGGNMAASAAHEIPLVGRMVGRSIERGVENSKGKMSETVRDRKVMQSLVDRNGKQRGSVQVAPTTEGAADSLLGDFHSKFPEPASAGYSGKRVGNANVDLARDPFDPNRAHVEMLRADEMRQGQGHQALKKVTDLADRHGTTLQLDATPVGKGGPSAAQLKDFYQRHGFNPDTDAPAATANTMTREPKGVTVPSGQRGSFSFQNDNDFNRAAASAKAGQRGGVGENIRNPRSEYNANRQIAGNPAETAERADILRRLSGQRGSVQVMNGPSDLNEHPQTKTDAFKTWSKGAPLITSNTAASHEFKTGEPVTVEAFHGTKRPDRVGDTMLRSRATSGPMAFHTSDPELASNYAKSKGDTSLANEDQSYENWFKYRPEGSRSDVPVDRMWHHLDPDVRKKIFDIAPTLHQDDEGKIVSTPGNKSGNGSYDYNLKQARGNPLKALTEDWLNSGNLFGKEENFMDVLHKAGVPKGAVKFDDPNAEYPSVYRNYIHMNKPLVTSDIPSEVTTALNNAAKTDRSKPGLGGADMWDKNNRTLRDWVGILNSDEGKHAWTSIPDKATAIFKKLGYDGIIDKSGKNGGPEHPVYVPFTETQVKSAIGNKGKFDPTKKKLTAKNESAQSSGANA